MTSPVLMVVDDASDSLATLEATLRRRYARDYQVISEASPAAALDHLRQVRAGDRPVTMVLAAAAMAAAPAAEFLAHARTIAPAAKRVLVVPRGGPAAPSMRVPVPLVADREAAAPVLRAMAHGMIDAYLPAPGAGRDEGFHRGISELLEEWGHEATPALPAVQIIDQLESARAHELRDVLARNSVPYLFHTADSEEGRNQLEQAGQDGSVLPVLVTYTGQVLVDPPADQIAAVFGLASLPAGTVDVAIVGAGPAGLSAGVYAASEGLSTLLLEREAIGGQAGSSSLIRNYLGFPRGISGSGLASRAFEQAWSFGAIPSMAGSVTGLQSTADGLTLQLANGRVGRARSVLITTGVSYRKLEAPGLDALLGAGVFYGATGSESSAFSGEHIYIAGGANSAGQAAVNLARYAQQVTILIRGDSLGARMSQYLIEVITATANIDVRTNTHVAAAEGTARLDALTLTDTRTGNNQTVPATALIVLIGAVPHTEWLPPQISRDEHGFILTGTDLPQDGSAARRGASSRPPFQLETSMPGVFAAGDVRHASVKRVASAVGEGSIAATQVYQYLQEKPEGRGALLLRRPSPEERSTCESRKQRKDLNMPTDTQHSQRKQRRMDAVVIQASGPPAQALAVRSEPVPHPGPGEVLVEVLAAAVNPLDVANSAGLLGTPLPMIPGVDFAGVVVSDGDLHAQEVWGSAPQLGMKRPGTHARFVALPETWLSRKPERLTMTEAGAVGRPYLAAWETMIEAGGLKPGETVLITGGAGMVGQAATAVARWRGAKSIIAGAHKPEGAEYFIDTSSSDLREAILELTDGRGADMVLDTVGGALFEPAVKSLRFGGRLTGLHSHERTKVDLVEIYSYERHVTGLASVFMDGAHCANIFDQLAALFDRGVLTPPAIKTWPLENSADAYQTVQDGSAGIKQVLLPVGSRAEGGSR